MFLHAPTVGLQHGVILDAVPAALNITVKTMADHMKEAGYSTAMVGKWHREYDATSAWLPMCACASVSRVCLCEEPPHTLAGAMWRPSDV